MVDVPSNPQIFHITHVANLASILQYGCLWSDSKRIALDLSATNIAYSHIKRRRLVRPVTVGGCLGDYVPFNFCPRSVMLYVVSRGHQEYGGGQDDIVHLVSSVSTATSLGKPWAFTDRHADLAYASYFDSVDQFGEVEWRVMSLQYWAADDEVKEKRQAEFLVHESFPWSAVESIGVKHEQAAAKVQGLLSGSSPPVVIRPDWYY